MSDALELLRPLITERIRELLALRLLTPLKFFEHKKLKPEYERSEIKLTLLLVRMANPNELLNGSETDLISTGMSAERTPRQGKIKPPSDEISAAEKLFKPLKATQPKPAKSGTKVGPLKTKGDPK